MSTQSLSNVQATLAPGALALLGFVRRQPRHGYDIYRQLSQAPELRAVWRVKQSRLYAQMCIRDRAAVLGGYLHGAAGQLAADYWGNAGLLASELADWVSHVRRGLAGPPCLLYTSRCV